MSAEMLALVVRTERNYPGGDFVDFDVCDSRTEEVLATRSCLPSANEVAVFVNSTYPIASQAPAHDTLVHEVIGFRISGEPPVCIETWVMLNHHATSAPWGVPTGPGWDHLIDAARS